MTDEQWELRKAARRAEVDTMVRAKLKVENVMDLSDATLVEKLGPCCGSAQCLESARRQVANGLTLHLLYTEFPVSTF